MNKLKNYFRTAKSYVITHKKDFTIGAGVFVGLGLLTLLIVFIVNNIDRPADIVYKPARACDLFTLNEAYELIGTSAFESTEDNEPVLSGNTVTSKCGYSDGNPDMDAVVVAAIVVRSGINDAGVEQNRNDFQRAIPDVGVQSIEDLGNSAYFNEANGQLNVLTDFDWIIFSYGLGSDPTANTVDKAIELAQKVVN